MTQNCSRIVRPGPGVRTALALAALLAAAAPAARAQEAPPPEGGPLALDWSQGPGTASIGGDLAQLELGEGFVWLDQAGTKQFLEMTQNPTAGNELAIVASMADGENWFLVFEYDAIGYVRDDEKDEMDADAMLAAIREGTAQGNEERTKRGWPTLEIVGWQEPPHYDAQSQNLTWAIVGESEGQRTINKLTKLLGRRGVMSVTLVASPEEYAAASTGADGLLAAYSFQPGNTYAEYVEGSDSVAEIGLKALVIGGAGAALLKSGLLGKLWKFLVAGVVVAGGAISRLFGRSKEAGPGAPT